MILAKKNCAGAEFYEAMAKLKTDLPKSISETIKLIDRTREEFPAPRLCFDEYGLLFGCCQMDSNMTQKAPFWSALWLATFFHICFDHADAIGMANLPGTINMKHALLLLEDEKIVATPSYHLFKTFRKYAGSDVLECTVNNTNSPGADNQPALSCSAALQENGKTIILSVINLDHQ